MITRIEDASVIGLQVDTIKMQSGETRQKQTVFLSISTSRGMMMEGFELWDENIEKFDLQQGDVINADCRLVGRQWGGRISYTLIAYNIEKVVKQ